MGEFWALMQWPLLAAMVMSPVHCLFGLHIVRRGVIFIDLAVAQMAALGMAVAVARGHDVHSAAAYWIALAFALGSALAIALSRHKLGRVPHEAIIGIIFVLASALGIVVLEQSPHGLEELRDLLSGSILLVMPKDVQSTAIAYGLILLTTLLLWKRTTAISEENPDAPEGIRRTALDFLFYGLLAFVVASSVKIAGVLVVFTWLVMPPVLAFFWVDRVSRGLVLSIPLALLGSAIGLWLSFQYDWPTGPAIVMVFGIGVVLTYLVRLVVPMREVAVRIES
ncbi:MAG TPA: metal ABC transporter permease [Fimbriimonadaceae bacterium]|nr:metal ABC transporter permease [Fimbriimonadaceae bacterium]HRJ95815.1 metal ABC transporter permease [Fimbriimonadaceae bacterium]